MYLPAPKSTKEFSVSNLHHLRHERADLAPRGLRAGRDRCAGRVEQHHPAGDLLGQQPHQSIRPGRRTSAALVSACWAVKVLVTAAYSSAATALETARLIAMNGVCWGTSRIGSPCRRAAATSSPGTYVVAQPGAETEADDGRVRRAAGRTRSASVGIVEGEPGGQQQFAAAEERGRVARAR